MITIVNRDVPLLTFRQAALEVVIGKDISNYAYWFHTLPGRPFAYQKVSTA